jgi:hypothetical protein
MYALCAFFSNLLGFPTFSTSSLTSASDPAFETSFEPSIYLRGAIGSTFGFTISCFLSFIRMSYEYVIVNPLRTLYVSGPTQFGFWGGMTNSQICDVISPVSTTFWRDHSVDCSEIIERKFRAFRLTVEILLYFYFIYQMFCLLFFWCERLRRHENPELHRRVIYVA